MTKDDAYRIAARGANPSTEIVFSAGGLVDCLEALGVLQLDAPKRKILLEIFGSKLRDGVVFDDVVHELNANGYRIVSDGRP